MQDTEVIIREHNALSDKDSVQTLLTEYSNLLFATDKSSGIDIGNTYATRAYGVILREASHWGKILIAEKNGEVVGIAAGKVEEVDALNKELNPKVCGRLTQFFVTEEYRGNGIGGKLYASMENYFKSQKCTNIRVEVLAANKEGYEFYKRHGFEDRQIEMIKEIN